MVTFLESDTETEGAKITVLKQGSSSSSASNLESSLQNRVSAMVSNLKNHFTKFLGTTESKYA